MNFLAYVHISKRTHSVLLKTKYEKCLWWSEFMHTRDPCDIELLPFVPMHKLIYMRRCIFLSSTLRIIMTEIQVFSISPSLYQLEKFSCLSLGVDTNVLTIG